MSQQPAAAGNQTKSIARAKDPKSVEGNEKQSASKEEVEHKLDDNRPGTWNDDHDQVQTEPARTFDRPAWTDNDDIVEEKARWAVRTTRSTATAAARHLKNLVSRTLSQQREVSTKGNQSLLALLTTVL